MKVSFTYDKEKDIWCLLNKGKSSRHSQKPTKQYEQLVAAYGDSPSADDTSAFIAAYLSGQDIDIEQYVSAYQADWDIVSDEFSRRAEKLFGISLRTDMTAYLTINSRCPYSLEENYFFVTLPTYDHVARRTAMHELWHFYTWRAFGQDQVERLGAQKYGDLKEALTVLINIECADLLPEDVQDKGYPQHEEMRQHSIEFWKTNKNIHELWEYLINL